ncbi:TRZ/ATZ family hydrolase [Arhodomonas sp. KWT]|uniref:TRZ/ATZ family hydrolase n=1 Tax=Arhodomonas sp. KWT TaxID=2679915 RepID=UPI0013D86ECC|nr:TRZ/ATZ family hydrolase [Arhodomonas sp. KWT]
MQTVDQVIHAGWVIPVEPSGQCLPAHSVVIDGGRIEAVLPTDEAGGRYEPRVVHDRRDHAVLPGFVNAHTHAGMNLLRGLADDLPLMTWLNEHIWPAEAAHAGPEFVQDGTRLAVAEMLRGGTTCFNDMYFFPDVTARTARQAGIRAVVGMIFIDFPTAWASGPDEYIDKGLAVHDAWRDDALITTTFAPHAPYTVSEPNLERLRTIADELALPVHIHLHETADEIQQSLAATGERPIRRLDRLGLLGPGLIAVHMTQLEDAEIARIAETGVQVVHCPESNLKLASGLAPVAALGAAGVNVALGTDGAASNNDLDMLGELRTAAMLAKGVARDPAALPAARALEAATLGGARALGLGDRVGSLTPGKEADVIAVRMDGIESAPLFHPISQLVYASGRDQVSDTWVAGRHLFNDGVLTTLDQEEIVRRAHGWRDKIAGKPS